MLPPDSMEKEYEQNCSYSIGFFRQVKTCFMEGTPYEVLLFLARVDKKDAKVYFYI